MRMPPGMTMDLLDPNDIEHQPLMHSHDIICMHTMVGSLAGTRAMFKLGGYSGTESHMGTGAEGESLFWTLFARTADANLNGKYRVISWETADTGPGFPAWSGSNVPEWTDAQCEEFAQGIAYMCAKESHADCPESWECHKSGIPCELIPDSKPGRRGIGYHRMGVDSSPLYQPTYRVPGGELWSESKGKECPGDKRIAQLKNVVIPRAKEIMNGTPWPDFGDTSQAVINLHQRLRWAGFWKGGDAPDHFGDNTKEAIAAFQRSQGWSGGDADGVIGPRTWELIQALPLNKPDGKGDDDPRLPNENPDVVEVMKSIAKTRTLIVRMGEKHPNMAFFDDMETSARKLFQQGFHYWGDNPDQPKK